LAAERDDDLRRRYLRQQAELGGAEMVLSGPVSDARAPARGPAPAPAVAAEEVAMAEKPETGGGERKWMKGAPAIPGPGLDAMPGIIPPELVALESLDRIAERIRSTYCCETLCPNRTNAVPGEGNPKARLMLVGEAPGQNEDEQGRPFIGAAGQLLGSILQAVELRREDVFIANVVKCRPPQNRKPLPHEVQSCIPYLWRQIELIRPAVLLAMGSTAAEALLGVRKSLGELRGKVHSYGGIPLVVTYHPAALLRNPNWKKPTWDDVRIARQLIDR
jgi:DNA polymerase